MLSEYRGKMIFTHPCQDNTVVRKKCQFTFDDSFKISLLIFFAPFYGQRFYILFTLCRRNSLCRLSVTLVHPIYSEVELFGYMFAPSDSVGTRAVCVNFLRNSRGSG